MSPKFSRSSRCFASALCGFALLVASGFASAQTFFPSPFGPPHRGGRGGGGKGQPRTTAPPTPIAYWSGNGNAIDSIGGNNGTLYGGVTFGPGVVNEGFVFNGTNGYVFIPDAPVFQLTNSLSITAWVNPVTVASNVVSYILFRGDDRSGYDPYFLGIDNTGNIVFTIEDADNNAASIAAPAPLGTPTFITATLDDATGEMRLSFGATTVSSGFTTIRPFGALDSGLDPGLAIGNTQDPGYSNQPFDGLIEEVSLYNVAIPNDFPFGAGVWGWGLDYLQFGLGVNGGFYYPGPIPTGFQPAPIAIAAGLDLDLILASDGTVWSSGLGGNGQLGNGGLSNSSSPVQASNLTDVVAISAGFQFSLALRADGSVWGWGYNGSGAAGNAGAGGSEYLPFQIAGPNGVGFLDDIVAISAGAYFSMALRSDGTVYTWGESPANADGAATPTLVPGLTNVVAISAGANHAVALTSDGTAWAWGDNTYGELGDGTSVTRSNPVPFLSGVVAAVAGADYTVVAKSDGTVWACGVNSSGQLGNGTTNSNVNATPALVAGLPPIASFAPANAASHVLALAADGTVWAWGDNSDGEIGIGTMGGAQTTPIETEAFAGAVAVAAGADTSLALVPTTGPISGKITLQGLVSNAPPQLVNFTFTPTGGGASFVRGAVIGSSGAYTLQNVPAGSYTVGIKSSRYLQTDVALVSTGAAITNLNATVLVGDVDGNNQIDLNDYNLFVQAFGSAIGDSNWNPNGDLNGDGQVNLDDFNLFVQNFGLTGDP